jgi:hypothetical protein
VVELGVGIRERAGIRMSQDYGRYRNGREVEAEMSWER